MAAQKKLGSMRELFTVLCSEGYVQFCLGKGTPRSHVQVIHCIVLRNILSGRLGRQWHVHSAIVAPNWLCSYICGVNAYYLREHAHWLQLQSKAGQMELYELLTKYAWGYAISLHKQGYGLDAIELAHEAFISCPERLRRYPFDVPLDDWLDRHISQCIERLIHPLPASLSVHDLADRLPDLSLSANSMVWDQWIDLARNIEQLSGENRAILHMWFLGFSLQETSRQLHLTEKAVSNRRSRIQKWLSAG